MFCVLHCRPPGIYKPDYIEELFKRYDDVADMPSAPERPDWCNGKKSDRDFVKIRLT